MSLFQCYGEHVDVLSPFNALSSVDMCSQFTITYGETDGAIKGVDNMSRLFAVSLHASGIAALSDTEQYVKKSETGKVCTIMVVHLNSDSASIRCLPFSPVLGSMAQ